MIALNSLTETQSIGTVALDELATATWSSVISIAEPLQHALTVLILHDDANRLGIRNPQRVRTS